MSSAVTLDIHQFRTNASTIVSFVGRNTLLGFTSSIRRNSIGFEISDVAAREQLTLGFTGPSAHGQILFESSK